MKMDYFSALGVQQVKKKYKEEIIGKEFDFDDTKIKHKLVEIVEWEAKDNCFNIKFISDCIGKFLTIYDFMELNKLKYNFQDFSTVSVSE
jgi:hypothetical protein